jgi:hypothetical protein
MIKPLLLSYIAYLASFSTFEGSEQQDGRVKCEINAVCGEISAAAPPSSEKVKSVGLRNISAEGPSAAVWRGRGNNETLHQNVHHTVRSQRKYPP